MSESGSETELDGLALHRSDVPLRVLLGAGGDGLEDDMIETVLIIELIAMAVYCVFWGAFCGLFLGSVMKLPTWLYLGVAAVGGYFIPDLAKWTLGVA